MSYFDITSNGDLGYITCDKKYLHDLRHSAFKKESSFMNINSWEKRKLHLENDPIRLLGFYLTVTYNISTWLLKEDNHQYYRFKEIQ